MCPCLSSNVSSHFYIYMYGFSPCLPSSSSALFSSLFLFPTSPSPVLLPLLPSSSPPASPPLPLLSSPPSSFLLSFLVFSPPTQHHSAEVLKWEESKRWQKRLEGLRTKLTEKNRELEAAQRQIKALKETLARCVS